jgi:hypothetical protein
MPLSTGEHHSSKSAHLDRRHPRVSHGAQRTIDDEDVVMTTNGEVNKLAIEAAARLYTNDPIIKRFDPELEKQIAGFNHLHQGDLPGVGRVRFLSSFPGQRGDWSISRSGLRYLLDALAAGKIQAGIVVLKQGAKVSNAKSATEVSEKLKDAVWLDYGNGEFTWVNFNFEPTNKPSGSGSYITDPDAASF